MKMSHAEITKWAYDHSTAEIEGKLTRRLVTCTEFAHKYEWSNGDSYEWEYTPCDYSKYIVTIRINGELVSREKWEHGWLENGNWGTKLIEEYPLEENAV